ncbi:secretory pathway Sec39 [Acrodontium crateriforme]|uniref:Secretory pathway Sec39 n=1 Tax=Acrodontium crateriforme TaxID=150365 RepID=A0AAQ3LZ71_9PEZI|nr:secretory pathway Sec39 [Acrodontium crateriforme]
MARNLSPAQCILLAVHYASSANILALHSFTPTRSDVLPPQLLLRIILTYLPESTEPHEYTTYVSEVASRLYLDVDREDVEVDISPVEDLSDELAERKVKKLQLLKLRSPNYPPHAPKDILTQFLCHRAYRIDSETGLLNLVPSLVEPFLDRNSFLRQWYVSLVLPSIRYQFEYYPNEENLVIKPLTEFEALDAPAAIDYLLQQALKHDVARSNDQNSDEIAHNISRDTKGLVGPWMYGYSERKRRKLGHHRSPLGIKGAAGEKADDTTDDDSDLSENTHKIALTGVTEDDITGHDWESMFRWLVQRAQTDFPVTSHCIENWNGPSDVDLGGFCEDPRDYLDADTQQKLELQFAQAAFASCYAAQADSKETIRCAHSILARLAEILDFIPPPDLASSLDLLPKIERHATVLDESQKVTDLEPENLLTSEHPLTTPRLETYMLLQLMVYSAYQLEGLGHPLSLVNVAKLHFYTSSADQVEVLRKILRGLSKSGARKDESQWEADRAKLIWLWNWGIDIEDETATTGAGVLGKVEKLVFEEELLKVFTDTACYDLAIKSFLNANKPTTTLSKDRISKIIIEKAMEAYDSASNGNKTRGGVKKANDIISAYRPHFKDCDAFRKATALIAATHALSFYSLTLQHGVPFQPVSIRVNKDAIGLIDDVLEQNPRSYTKLDDLIGVARNLVTAGLDSQTSEEEVTSTSTNKEALERRRNESERRVTFMAVQAALREEDFETAYSYIVSRLTPSGADITAPATTGDSVKKHARNASKASVRSSKETHEDDISWRAAFLAGRYRPATTSPLTIRRLEQRRELLSLALLLAPTSALTEILAAWRRCEEETTSLQLAQQAAEQEFDDGATLRQGSSLLPGNFTVDNEGPAMVLNQKRREMGRMVSSGAADEAPVSMFDLTKSAARAFSQGAFPLRASGSAGQSRPSMDSDRGLETSVGSLGADKQGSVRKRDMVANAVSGGLASGLGWMLGATPVKRDDQDE